MPTGRRRGSDVNILILAAGQGKRMRSGKVKLLHVLAGSPMVCHVARAAARLDPAVLSAVVGNQAEEVQRALSSDAGLSEGRIAFALQGQQLGTGHAVLQAEKLLAGRGRKERDLLILNGDVPLLRASTLRSLLRHHRRHGAAATVLTTRVDDPSGYGRVIRGEAGRLESIVEHRDATPAQRKIPEINAGLYCVDMDVLFSAIRKTGRDNSQGEYYLPDIIPVLRGMGRRTEAYLHEPAEEVLGVNDRSELAEAGWILYRRKAEELMESGVTIIDPDCTYIDPGVKVGRDTVIHPLARLQGATVIGRECSIGAMAQIGDSRLGRGVRVLDMCVINEALIGNGVRLGPFAHLRPGTVLEPESQVGNFVEVKKSRLGRGSKANHLAYLGDATIGRKCNIGAGTITCNYDGVSKHPTVLEDGVFVGSDTQLVAPVRVRKGAYIGAGATITRDVPAYALALSRPEQRVIEGYAKRRKRRKKREKR